MYKRQERGRSEDGDRKQFEIREAREAGWGLYTLIENADFSLNNESSLEDLVRVANRWLEEFKQNITWTVKLVVSVAIFTLRFTEVL